MSQFNIQKIVQKAIEVWHPTQHSKRKYEPDFKAPIEYDEWTRSISATMTRQRIILANSVMKKALSRFFPLC